MSRQEFDRATKIAIHERATDKRGVKKCENPACRAVIKGRACQVDHLIADGLKPDADKKRKLTPADGQLLCIPCHDAKTRKSDVPTIAKSKRIEAKHIGAQPAPIRPIQNRGFGKSQKSVSRESRAKDRLPVSQRKARAMGCFRIEEG